jgi:hypothetical protein
MIPRKRSGEAYFPSFLEPRRRSEQAIVAVVMEADVNGVGMRKVDRLVQQLGIGGMARHPVSALALHPLPARGSSRHRTARRSVGSWTGRGSRTASGPPARGSGCRSRGSGSSSPARAWGRDDDADRR